MQLTRGFTGLVAGLLLTVIGCKTEFSEAPTAGAAAAPAVAGTVAAPASGAGGMAGVAGMPPAAGAAGAAPTAGAGTGAAGAAGTPTAGASGAPAAGEVGAGAGGDVVPEAGSADEPVAGEAGAAPPEEPTCPATSVLQPGDSTGMIDAGGRTRSYLLHVPPSYDGVTPMPLLFDWHALLIDAATERNITGNLDLSDREGFIVVYPEGIDSAWNVGICCTSSRDVDDLAFARAMLDRFKQDGCIDTKRVYATGYSMGGGMSFHLACNESDLFAAVAPAAFDLMIEEEWPCHPSRPVPVIQFRSTGDFVVRYGGGMHWPPNGLPVPNNFLGAEGTFEKWAELDGCTGTPAVAANGCNTYTQCEGGAEVALCTKQGGFHDPPDVEVAWQFLSRFSLP